MNILPILCAGSLVAGLPAQEPAPGGQDAATEQPAPPADLRKLMVELPIKKALRPDTRSEGSSGRVEPGKVDWHASFDDARVAAMESKKPILLFQLLGRLDEEFC